MFLHFNYKSLHGYVTVRELVKKLYAVTILLPAEEKFNMVPQLKRAALSVKLTLAEGVSRKSAAERNQFIEIAGAIVVEIDAALETSVDLAYPKQEQLTAVGELLSKCFAMLSDMPKLAVAPVSRLTLGISRFCILLHAPAGKVADGGTC